MNELHLGFIVLAIVAIVIVIAYNKWQDFRQSKKAQTMLHRKNDENVDNENDNQKIEPNFNIADNSENANINNLNEDFKGTQATNLRATLERQQQQNSSKENTDINANINANNYQNDENVDKKSMNSQITVAPDIPFPNENYVDMRFEWSAILEFAEPISMGEIFSNAKNYLQKIGKPMTWLGYDRNSKQWEFLSPKLPERHLQNLIINLQLCNRDGAASEHDIHAFEALVNHLAETLMSLVKFTEINPSTTAKEIDDFCSNVDIEISINLSAKQQKYFNGSQILELTKQQNLEFIAQEGCFAKYDKQGNVIYKLMNNNFENNSDIEIFNAHTLNTLKTPSISFVLYVPCCPNGGESYNDLLINASHFAKVLDADLVDDNNRKLGAEELQRIMNDYIVRPQLIMQRKNFPPGSAATLRLFS